MFIENVLIFFSFCKPLASKFVKSSNMSKKCNAKKVVTKSDEKGKVKFLTFTCITVYKSFWSVSLLR
jgi:hypothetical protein